MYTLKLCVYTHAKYANAGGMSPQIFKLVLTTTATKDEKYIIYYHL